MSAITEDQLTKLYYSIGEVADLFGVNTSLIRFWEKEFHILKPKKNKKGNRLFTPKEIMKINMIYQLVKVQGFTLDGARQAIKSKSPALEQIENEIAVHPHELANKLEKVKRKLLEYKNQL